MHHNIRICGCDWWQGLPSPTGVLDARRRSLAVLAAAKHSAGYGSIQKAWASPVSGVTVSAQWRARLTRSIWRLLCVVGVCCWNVLWECAVECTLVVLVALYQLSLCCTVSALMMHRTHHEASLWRDVTISCCVQQLQSILTRRCPAASREYCRLSQDNVRSVTACTGVRLDTSPRRLCSCARLRDPWAFHPASMYTWSDVSMAKLPRIPFKGLSEMNFS